MSSTRAVSRTRLSTTLRPLARLRSGRNDRFSFDAIALPQSHQGADAFRAACETGTPPHPHVAEEDLLFDADSAPGANIREDQENEGVRIPFTAGLVNARIATRIRPELKRSGFRHC